jgi:hypothetical protein
MRNTLRKGYRRIPGMSNYAMNREGRIYRLDDNTSMTPSYNRSHWSGSIKLRDDSGNRHYFNIAQLVSRTFRITREETLRETIQFVTN